MISLLGQKMQEQVGILRQMSQLMGVKIGVEMLL